MSPLSDRLHIKLQYDFLWLLIALGLLIFLPSFIPDGMAKDATIYLTLLLACVFSVFSTSTSRMHLYVNLGLVCLVVGLNLLPISPDATAVFISRMGVLIIFFSYTALTILYRIANARKVSLNIIFGSIAGYLLMGVLGGLWCRLIDFLYPGSFSLPTGLEPQLDTLTYFSFVTMSSLGYGDITPITAPGRSTAIFIAITGQMYLAINIALLVGSYARTNSQKK